MWTISHFGGRSSQQQSGEKRLVRPHEAAEHLILLGLLVLITCRAVVGNSRMSVVGGRGMIVVRGKG